MANSINPYRRVGNNSWQELLDQVNDELQNPEPGCDAIDPIEIPAPMHRWAKSDIREVHDKLDEMPTDCFDFAAIPDLWKVSIIDDIEDQLGEAWCDCGDEQCCSDCSNSGTLEQRFLGSAHGCTMCNTPCSCRTCKCTNGNPFCHGVDCIPIIQAAPQGINSGFSQWSNKMCEYCDNKQKVDIFEEEITKLEDAIEVLEMEISDLETAKNACETQICIDDIQSQIDAKETEKTEKETCKTDLESKRDIVESDRDAALADANTGYTNAITLGAALNTCASTCCQSEGCLDCYVDDAVTETYPTANNIDDLDCEFHRSGIAAKYNNSQKNVDLSCCPCDTFPCRAATASLQVSSGGGAFTSRIYGTFDPKTGEWYVTGFASAICECTSQYCCCCTKLPGMGATGVACSSCGPGGNHCDVACTQGCDKEWQLWILPPFPFDDFDCEDNLPCDGEPPENGVPAG